MHCVIRYVESDKPLERGKMTREAIREMRGIFLLLIRPRKYAKALDLEYGQCDAANALKRFLIGQFVKFFLLIGPSNVSKHL